ncbi:MAG: hypothetical protein RL470_267 [Actinomycetota bacterium]
MNTPLSIADFSARLRSIRISKSLSLNDVETLSQGTLKAVVLGSYERGARTLSVKRAMAIAELYQIPLAQLFSDEVPVEVIDVPRAILDLRTINKRALDRSHYDYEKYQLVARVAQRVIHSRQDWNGEVLSIRHGDIETIATLFDQPLSTVLQWLDTEKILLKVRQS